MFTAHIKRKKIVVKLEKEIDDWLIKNRDVDQIVSGLLAQLRAHLADEILSSMEYKIKEEFQNKILKELVDSDFAMDVFKEKMREQLSQTMRFY